MMRDFSCPMEVRVGDSLLCQCLSYLLAVDVRVRDPLWCKSLD